MARIRLIGALVGVVCVALGTVAAAAGARDRGSFRPRVGGAMGLLPPADQESALATPVPVVYHGGTVMSGPVRLHPVFWAPAGYRFGGAPGPGSLGYVTLIEQFLRDSARDSGLPGNLYSVLREYPDSGHRGAYALSYRPGDAITDAHPFPRARCPSPSGIATCVTDLQVQRELARLIARRAPRSRGSHDLWLVFLPPDVDECISVGVCGTNSFAGYHALSDLGKVPVIYSVVIDPLIEFTAPPGADPEGNPDAEVAIDTVAHETVEAVTDPFGAGWLDPNGFEVGDKCENGPQEGTPLGYASNGSPYNQIIAGHRYLIQSMWSNAATGCRQRSRSSRSALPLPEISLTQFSPWVSGTSGAGRAGLRVGVGLLRAGQLVAVATGRTRAGGAWGPISLGAAVGDDRDQVLVQYGRGGPREELIETGNGGRPFTEAGWTGWYDLDSGFGVARRSVTIAPCGQVGVLALSVAGRSTPPPVNSCQTETNLAVVRTGTIGPGTAVRMSSEDNRAPSELSPAGGLVRLSIALGEPGSVANLFNDQVPLMASGFPLCTAELRVALVRCSGLVPGARYRLDRARASGRIGRSGVADFTGAAVFSGFPGPRAVRGGDRLTLRNAAGRVLTVLHVSHLQVHLEGNQNVISAGACEPGEYWGPPVSSPPSGPAIGFPGVSGTGMICPDGGDATGMPAGDIEQTDQYSGGRTQTVVPLIEGTAPIADETVYGAFRALAQAGLPSPTGSVVPVGAPVSMTIRAAGSRQVVRRLRNVDTPRGVAVNGLRPGVYVARWVLTDANGDTRALETRFVQEG